MPGISLIIPTYNRADFLRDTLQSVAEIICPQGVEWEVLVIDNNCTDDTPKVVAEAAKNFPCELRHIVEHQQGLCYGRNRGLREARFAHLAYLDDDIRVGNNWVKGYFEAVNEDGADAVAGPVFPMFSEQQPDYLVGRALQIISSGYSRKGSEKLVLPREFAHELAGCNFGVKKAAAESINGFDNSLDRVGNGLIAGGDFDFGKRLVAAGKRTVYHPDCSIQHFIIPEKLTKTYLRRRAYGLGATRRLMTQGLKKPSSFQRLKQLARIGRMGGGVVGLRLLGRKGDSFSREIDLLQSIGFLVTKPRETDPGDAE
ncbi:MAG: glycosyltransferase family 2 protein [Planctomycetaceae bacterium]|nr:glycosyltransferase family 2 protein [Planctomycetaceae bacterium]